MQHRVHYGEVDQNYYMNLSSMLRVFQNISAWHSERVGYGIRDLQQQSIFWTLGKLRIEVKRYPEYGELLDVSSWSRGPAGFRMLRDYRVSIGDETVALGSSVWFMYHMKKKRIIRVPENIIDGYETDTEQVFAEELRSWSQYRKFTPEFNYSVSLRRSDLAAANHVNNTNYGDFVMDALSAWELKTTSVKDLKIQYRIEIPDNVQQLEVGLLRLRQTDNNKILFRLVADERVYSDGELLI